MSDHGHPAEAHVSLRRCCSADLTWHSRRGGRARRSYVSALEGTRFDRRAESEPREIPRRDASRRRARSARLRTRVRADHHPLPRSPASRSLARDRRPWPPRHGDNADALPPASQDTGNRISFIGLRACAETHDSDSLRGLRGIVRAIRFTPMRFRRRLSVSFKSAPASNPSRCAQRATARVRRRLRPLPHR